VGAAEGSTTTTTTTTTTKTNGNKVNGESVDKPDGGGGGKEEGGAAGTTNSTDANMVKVSGTLTEGTGTSLSGQVQVSCRRRRSNIEGIDRHVLYKSFLLGISNRK
jgi:hypothetical protein